ncbi:helix-turn-helix transcriptional regulator [Marinomonas epiphytica]
MKMKDTLDSLEPEKKPKKKKKLKKESAKKKSGNKKKTVNQIKKSKDLPRNTELKGNVKKSPVIKPSATKTPPPSAPEAKLAVPNEPTKVNLDSQPQVSNSSNDISRNRVSKNLQVPLPHQQSAAIENITKRLLLGEISQGLALRELRVKILGLRQETFANQVGVSRKTLSEIENNKGNYTSEVINKVFKPFDLRVGLLPADTLLLKSLVTE